MMHLAYFPDIDGAQSVLVGLLAGQSVGWLNEWLKSQASSNEVRSVLEQITSVIAARALIFPVVGMA